MAKPKNPKDVKSSGKTLRSIKSPVKKGTLSSARIRKAIKNARLK